MSPVVAMFILAAGTGLIHDLELDEHGRILPLTVQTGRQYRPRRDPGSAAVVFTKFVDRGATPARVASAL